MRPPQIPLHLTVGGIAAGRASVDEIVPGAGPLCRDVLQRVDLVAALQVVEHELPQYVVISPVIDQPLQRTALHGLSGRAGMVTCEPLMVQGPIATRLSVSKALVLGEQVPSSRPWDWE